MHNFEEIPAGVGSAVSLWWNGGRSFEAPPELVDIFATSTMEGPTVKNDEGEAEEHTIGCTFPIGSQIRPQRRLCSQALKRRRSNEKPNMCIFSKRWCHSILKKSRSWSAAPTFRSIWECAPELYEDVQPLTLARCKRPGMDATLAVDGWNKQVISEGMRLRLVTIAKRITTKISVSSSVLRTVVCVEIERLGDPASLEFELGDAIRTCVRATHATK